MCHTPSEGVERVAVEKLKDVFFAEQIVKVLEVVVIPM